MENRGVKPYKIKYEDWKFGADNEIDDKVIINPSKDWTPYHPELENQADPFETMGCVSYSAADILQMIMKCAYGIDINFDDRWLTVASGTGPRGNTFKAVAEFLRTNGIITEDQYPEATTWNEYYKKPLPEKLYTLAKQFLIYWKINYEWVYPSKENLKEALKYAPLQIGVKIGGSEVRGDKIVYTRTEGMSNHAIKLLKVLDNGLYKVGDQYERDIKYLAEDFDIQYAYLYTIKPIMDFIKNKNNSTVYLKKGKTLTPINSARDYLNLEEDWEPVKELDVGKLVEQGYTISDKKLYTFEA